MSFKELKNFLKEVNIEVDDYHAKEIFQVTTASRLVVAVEWGEGLPLLSALGGDLT